MRWIPPGSNWQGSPDHEEGRKKNENRRFVEFTRGFWIGETPVTQALWEAVIDDNPSFYRGPQRPVEEVSYDDCQRFLGRLNGGPLGLHASLPDEARWEYACRAGTSTPTYAPDEMTLDEIAWHAGNSERSTHDVGMKACNAWGLHDMLGNVWEWCEDQWDGATRYAAGPVWDPKPGVEGSARVVRGGSWRDGAQGVRAACRDAGPPGFRYGVVGFRLAEVRK